MMNFIQYLLVASIILSSSAWSYPLRLTCGSSFLTNREALAKRVKNLDSTGKALLKKYKKLKKSHRLKQYLTEDEAILLASESDITLYQKRFEEFLADIENAEPRADIEQLIRTKARQLLREQKFTEAQIARRLSYWEAQKPYRWYRLFGDRTVKEVRTLYMGTSLDKLSPESLVGQYVAQTEAQTKIVRIPIAPGSNELGPPKLLVAVSESSFEQFKTIMDQPYAMSVLGHANVLHRGNVITFGGAKAAMRLPSENTPLPFLIFKTTESERLNRYLEYVVNHLDNKGWNAPIKLPWMLEGYCATGGYTCCTHWLGNIPIGDTRVVSYKFPGRVENGQGPQIQVLGQYSHPDAELRQIWKTPGHEQLSSVIGQEKANLNGEFASPGWVIQTLLGPTDNRRVPIIFYITSDHKAPLADDVVNKFQFERPW